MFKSEQFLIAWSEWKEHYTEKSHHGYTAVAERKALSSLWQKCCGREQLAIDSINYSMEKNWNAVYIKPIDNVERNSKEYKQEFRANVQSEFDRRYGNQ